MPAALMQHNAVMFFLPRSALDVFLTCDIPVVQRTHRLGDSGKTCLITIPHLSW